MSMPAKELLVHEDADSAPSIIFAYTLDGKGGAHPCDAEAISAGHLPKSTYWVHLFLEDPETQGWLEKYSELDDTIIEALMQPDTRPRVNESKDGALVIFRGMNLNDNAEPEDMVSVRLYVDKHRIISIRRRRLRAVHDVREALVHGHGPNDTGEFVAMLSDFLCARIDPTLTTLHLQMDDAEEEVLLKPDAALRHNIIDIRKQAIIFHRYLAPQRDALARLKTLNQLWIHDNDKRLLAESYDRMTRYVEDLDAVRDRAQIVNDELSYALSDKLNRNTFILSTVSAIFLPLTFLTGLLGVNLHGIPHADSPMAFYVFCCLLAICAVVQVSYLRKLHWI